MVSGARIALVWVIGAALLFGMFTLVQRWENERRTKVVTTSGQARIVLDRGRDQHFWIEAVLEGPSASRKVRFMLDTGASTTTISETLAQSLGLPKVGTGQFNTANGVVNASLHTAALELPAGLRLERLRVAAMPRLGPDGLLGMDVLGRLQLEQQGKTLTLSLP
jgi:aspartyl protease family protein